MPAILIKNMMVLDKPNPINNKLDVSGVRRSLVSKDLCLKDIKKAAKRHGATVNDYVTAALGLTVQRYFMEKNFNLTKHVTVAFPISIRYDMPHSVDEVIIGNFFSIQMIKLPLSKEFTQMLSFVHRCLNQIKRSFEYYSVYLISLVTGTMFPY